LKPQWLKNCYYETMGRLSLVSYLWHKTFPRLPKDGRVVLHLGCGTNYISNPGFINIDGNLFRRKDLWLDITIGLPFPDSSVDVVFASHLLEHMNEREVRRVLGESYRVLRPGGAVRFITPHLGKAIKAYLEGDLSFFSDWPDRRKSIGGKLNNHLLCRDQHRLMFDLSFLRELLLDAGFNDCRELGPLESEVFGADELGKIQWENSENHRSLFVEAFKAEQ
jgi:predicted SAM-dependent methyltransferase